MDEQSKNVVDIALARVANGEVQKEIRRSKLKKYGSTFSLVAILVISVYFYEPNTYIPTLTAQQPRTSVTDEGNIQVSVQQDRQGHYVFQGEINGKKVVFLLDTGATNVAVPVDVAQYLRLPMGESYYSNTANGKSLSYASQSKKVKVGGIELMDIETSIATGMKGDEILLGMSFLKNLSIRQDKGKMVLIKDTSLSF